VFGGRAPPAYGKGKERKWKWEETEKGRDGERDSWKGMEKPTEAENFSL